MSGLAEIPEYARLAAEAATERARAVVAIRSNAGKPKWYVGCCGFRSDMQAIKWLDEFGVENYYPRLKLTRPVPQRKLSHAQRKLLFAPTEHYDEPLFPRYVFVHIDFDARRDWRDVFRQSGIGSVLGDGVNPLPLTDNEIAKIRGKETDGAIPEKTPLRYVLDVGTDVVITHGPFAAFTGKIIERLDEPIASLDAKARITVLASLFGRQTPVELDIDQVKII